MVVETAGDRRQDVADLADGRQGRVRQGGAGRGARRPRRPRGALGQGPAVARSTGWCSPRCPSAARRATRWSGSTLADLPAGGRVATGSARRRAQLADLRPDLTFAELRGNIATRLERASEHDAVVMAAVALERLGRSDAVTRVLPTDGDAAAGRARRARRRVPGRRRRATRRCSPRIEHEPSRRAVDAERAFLAELGGDCDLPGRRLRTRRRRTRRRSSRSKVCWRRSTGASCCATASVVPIRSQRRSSGRNATCSIDAGGREVLVSR